jgi:MFS family permease
MSKTDTSGVPSPAIWKDPLFWFIIAVGLGYGSVRNFLPTTFPVLRREMGATLENMGQAEFLFYLSSVLIGVLGGTVLAWLGLKRAAVGALALTSLSLLVMGSAGKIGLVLLCSGTLGLAIVSLVVIMGSTISNHFHERRQSVFLLTGLSDASGTMLGPALLGLWIVHAHRWNLTWRSGFFVGAGTMACLAVCALFVSGKSMGDASSNAKTPGTNLQDTKLILSNSSFYTSVLLCFCHGLAQAGMVAFIGQLYTHKLHVDAAQAAYLLSGEGAGILGGRLIFGWITARWKIPELVVISMCAAAETVAFFAAILSPSYIGGLVMFTVGGIFMSAIGPSLNSYLGGRLAARVATAFSLFAGLGNMGAAIGPFVIGVLGTHLGIARGILFSPLFSALLSIVGIVRYLSEKRVNVLKPAPVVTSELVQ